MKMKNIPTNPIPKSTVVIISESLLQIYTLKPIALLLLMRKN